MDMTVFFFAQVVASYLGPIASERVYCHSSDFLQPLKLILNKYVYTYMYYQVSISLAIIRFCDCPGGLREG